MTFQVTARDNRAGGGGVNSTTATVNINAGSGPFKVTAQDAPASPDWTTGSSRTVTWNVANTTAAPVSAANVDITLSIDGGQTFPFVLATGVPNNSTANIVVPNGTVTNQARIKVQGAGNIFFDINNADFNIVTAPTAANVSISGNVIIPNNFWLTRIIVTLTDSHGVSKTAVAGKFGSFIFRDVSVGETYILRASARDYSFAPQVITPTQDITNIDFIFSVKTIENSGEKERL